MTLLISDIFTVSDEAFALAMVDNYYRRWILQEKYQNDKSKTRKATGEKIFDAKEDNAGLWRGPQFDAKWSSSAQGRKDQGWSDAGITAFNHYCRIVRERRTGTADKKDMVDLMFRKCYANSMGYVVEDDSKGPIGSATAVPATMRGQQPMEVVEPDMDEEEAKEINELIQELSQQ